jgi:hypothetical protein
MDRIPALSDASLGNGDQMLGLAAHEPGFGFRRPDAITAEKLRDQVAPQRQALARVTA